MNSSRQMTHSRWLLLLPVVLLLPVGGGGCDDPAPCVCPDAGCKLDMGPGGDLRADLGGDLLADLGPSPDAAQKCGELWPCPAGYCCDKTSGTCKPCSKTCIYKPKAGDFKPILKWSWSSSTVVPTHVQVMMTPLVANFTDDNGDGRMDNEDIPDVVFHTFTGIKYNADGLLRMIRGDGSGEITAFAQKMVSQGIKTRAGTQLAAADLDGDNKPEIVTCLEIQRDASNKELPNGLAVLEHDGTLKWKETSIYCYAPGIVDLQGDGKPEVVVGYNVLDGATGTLWSGNSALTEANVYTVAADIDEDGVPEIVGGSKVLAVDATAGTLSVKWEDKNRDDGYVALADLDADGKVEIISVSPDDGELYAFHADGKPYWTDSAGKAKGVDINQGNTPSGDKCGGCGGGPPTVGDFDGDGKPEIGIAGAYGYAVFEHDGQKKWWKKTQDLTSRHTGSSVFDFEADGRAEVIYNDEQYLRVYNGADGKELFKVCNTSGTLQEYPLVVDVDNDGHAEIVVANNNYYFKTCPDGSASSTGIKVYADSKGNWVKTRRIWNQHAYHITNVDENAFVPKTAGRNWDNPNLNNFRLNVQPLGIFDAPDLTGVSRGSSCSGGVLYVTVEVRNVGAAKAAAGVDVTLYVKDPQQGEVALQTVQTQTTLDPSYVEKVSFQVTLPTAYQGKTLDLLVKVDDDGKGQGRVNECDETNNTITIGQQSCGS